MRSHSTSRTACTSRICIPGSTCSTLQATTTLASTGPSATDHIALSNRYHIMTTNSDNAPATGPHYFNLEWGLHAIMRLVQSVEFETVLAVGSGSGEQSRFFRHFGKEVFSINLTGNADYVGDFTKME